LKKRISQAEEKLLELEKALKQILE